LELIKDSQLSDEVRAKAVKKVVQDILKEADNARENIQRRTMKENIVKDINAELLSQQAQEALDKAQYLSAWWYYGLKKVKEGLVENKRYSDLAIEIKLEKPKVSARTLLQIQMELDDNLSKRIENGAAVLSPRVMEEALEIQQIRGTYLDNSLLLSSRANAAVR